MIYRWLADLLLVVHATFVVFVLFGALAVLRWPRLAWLHVPAAAWGAFVEFSGWICPLTPLENEMRIRGGEAGYSGGFIEHYLLPTLYPAALTRPTQWALGTCVLLLNITAYWLLYRRRQSRPAQSTK